MNQRHSISLISESPEKTARISQLFATQIHQNFAHWQTKDQALIINLCGNLGMGKTEFARAFIQKLAQLQKISLPIVNSPTYSLINEYPLKNPIYHIDCYRLNDELELTALGIDDKINNKQNIILVEWAEKVADFFSNCTINIKISAKQGQKILQFEVYGKKLSHKGKTKQWLNSLPNYL